MSPSPGDWQREADRLSARAIAGGDPTGWFDRLYRAASSGEVSMPWDRTDPNPLLADWARSRGGEGAGRTAMVVGCGLGADAEFLAALGFATSAFDVSPEAIRLARERASGTVVDYAVGDLLDLPARWLAAFDLVVEIWTAQALPDPPRAQAIRAVGGLVAPGGTLLAIAMRREDGDPEPPGPPWPLLPAEIAAFAGDDLAAVAIERVGDGAERRWRAEFHRPAPPPGVLGLSRRAGDGR